MMKRLLLLALPLLGFVNGQTQDAGPFTATITDFRMSAQGATRFATATVRFQNKSGSPVILGYVWDTGIATDDRGNRYRIVNQNSVRAIGLISGRTVDPKFVLPPGSGSDARFEFAWVPATRNDLFGSQIVDLEISVRQLRPEGGSQFSLGSEHLLHFNDPGRRSGAGSAVPPAAAPAPSASAPAAPAAPTAPPPAAVDHCAGKPRCSSGGPFIAEVTSVTGAPVGGRHHTLRVGVRFRNMSSQPVILSYKASTSIAVDNLGNQYYWGRAGTHDTSATGIPIFEGRTGNPSFTLQPGQTGNAVFALIRYEAGAKPVGQSFTHDLAVVELELLNGGQMRTGREFSLHFTDLTLAGAGAQSLNESVEKLKGIFSGGKKK